MAPFKASATPRVALLVNPLAWLLWLADFVLWLVSIGGPLRTLKFYLQGEYSVETAVGRRQKKNDFLETSASPAKAIRTTATLLDEIAEKYGDRECMGTRTFEGDYKPEGAKFALKTFGETTWLTFGDLRRRALAFGSALIQECGMEPLPVGADVEKVTGPHTILLYEDTSADWMTAALGATSYSLVVATSYATLGIASVAEAVDASNVPVVVTNRKQVGAVSKITGSSSLKYVVYTELNVTKKEAAIDATGGTPGGPKLVRFSTMIAKGLENPAPLTPPTAESVALIMYTSGSTGKPKGVMIKHSSICSSVGGLSEVIERAADPGDCYLGYLPQAHILEFCAELTCLNLGVKIGYADPRTLSSTGAARVMPNGELNRKAGYPYPPGAIQEFRPAFMAGVPKIWDILKKAMEDQVAKMSPLKKFVFEVAFVGRAYALKRHRDSPLLKALVFKKLAQMLGGNLKATVSGGGAISSEVQTFVRTAFSAPAVQGYALTETCCSATFQHTDLGNVDGVVGPPLTSVEIKLEDVDITDSQGKPYRHDDFSHLGERCKGRGEIMIKGPPLSVGYFKQPDKTAEVFTKDGWFHTGDVGVWREDGQLKIVDRLKNLVKLKGGEYVAIENMEKEYSTSAYVSQANGGVLCYGDHDMDRPVAFVVVDEKKLTEWAQTNALGFTTFTTFTELCASDEATKHVLQSLQKAGKSGNLGANEIIAAVLLLPGTGPVDNDPPTFDDPWTPENGMLTASNKLNRKAIIATYGADGIFDTLKAKGIK
mmetsp:Transcript_24798/g.80211  ORF Transcript_24798/g.80211 Transcript_24798/m.80211 type:complete len:770 (+) Transcript_24798:163-2472(+)